MIIFCFLIMVLQAVNLTWAQEVTEKLAIAVVDIKPFVFNPEKDSQVTVSGEIVYVTTSGTFGDLDITAHISELDMKLPVELGVLPTNMLPEGLKHLGKRWSFAVEWDGKDKENFVVKPGRYTCILEGKILKTDTIMEKTEDGQEVEKEIKKESRATATASLIVQSQ
jgi:hypothetical protein